MDALTADPSLSDREAASLATAGLRGVHSSNAERVRKKYRQLKRAGQLPERGDLGLLKQKAKILREHHVRRLAFRAETERELEQAGKEAAAIGLDLSGDLEALERSLEEAELHLRLWVRGPIDYAEVAFSWQGILDPEEQIALLARYAEELHRVENKLGVLRRVRKCRFILRR